jgi:hypothetical protein
MSAPALGLTSSDVGKKSKRAAPIQAAPVALKEDLMTLAPQIILLDELDVPALVREIYSRFPEIRYREPYELRCLLWCLSHSEDLIPEGEIAAAIGVARSDFDPDESAA